MADTVTLRLGDSKDHVMTFQEAILYLDRKIESVLELALSVNEKMDNHSHNVEITHLTEQEKKPWVGDE